MAVSGFTGVMGGDSSPTPGGACLFLGHGAGSRSSQKPRGVGGVRTAKPRLPSGHRFFPDCEREIAARWIEWAMNCDHSMAWFTTLTFKDYISPYLAEKKRDRWLARMSQAFRDIGGTRLRSCCATEWQSREVVHYHLLILGNGSDAPSRKRWECRWMSSGGGFARNYDAVKSCAPYLAKYMNKSRGGELQVGGAWRGTKPPASVSRCCSRGGEQHTLALGFSSLLPSKGQG